MMPAPGTKIGPDTRTSNTCKVVVAQAAALTVQAALLHGSVEKGSLVWPAPAAGADDRLIAIVDALTERDGEPDVEYFARCAADALALRIKRTDVNDKFEVLDHAGLPDDRRHQLWERAPAEVPAQGTVLLPVIAVLRM